LFPGDTNVIGTLTTGQLVADGSGSINFDLGFDTTPGLGSNDLIQVNGNWWSTARPLSSIHRVF